jgi:hypothetical protein
MDEQEHVMHKNLHTVQIHVNQRQENVLMERYHEVMEIVIVHCMVLVVQVQHIHYHHVQLIENVVVVHHIQHHEKQHVQNERQYIN